MDSFYVGSNQLSKDQQLLQKQHQSIGNTLRTSRSPSTTRSSEQMSRERDQRVESSEPAITGSIGGGSVSSGGIVGTSVATFRGFRSHSPSNRRSRERNRREFNRTHGSDQGGLLAYSGMGGGLLSDISAMDSGGSGSGVTIEDSRLSGNEDLCYQSFASDDVDGNPPSSLADNNKKHHRHHERTSSLQAIDRLNTKIQCTKESIRKEQTARDGVSEYWIFGLKNLIKKCIRECVRCTRYKALKQKQLMGDLPEYRVNVSAPFAHCGVDYAGPLLIKCSKGRGQKTFKGYVAVFVCMATKALHLELVSDMTSDSFLAALKRLFARRGKCSHVYSDNGTNFVGASKKLDKDLQQAIKSNVSAVCALEAEMAFHSTGKSSFWRFMGVGREVNKTPLEKSCWRK
ncbi:uncharacterized protein LOC119675547 [Teleopsis dalmanni]|uniref:uncharacterized protein LOC119675547 n=1 Tax=Teleopsis dalmanni TaxID=139649 RepID=UPI0018CC7EF6|nr:uncharacterized protein LOC119675547 [Teleopsis dalmanni]